MATVSSSATRQSLAALVRLRHDPGVAFAGHVRLAAASRRSLCLAHSRLQGEAPHFLSLTFEHLSTLIEQTIPPPSHADPSYADPSYAGSTFLSRVSYRVELAQLTYRIHRIHRIHRPQTTGQIKSQSPAPLEALGNQQAVYREKESYDSSFRLVRL
ncbi:hypothetical protein VDGL01_10088 [Verticillium dahliae]